MSRPHPRSFAPPRGMTPDRPETGPAGTTVFSTLCWIAAGGAVGAVARFGVVSGADRLGFAFPWGTLVVNVSGSFLIGLALGALAHHARFDEAIRPFFVVGVLGAFTTFSAFSVETLLLLADDRWLPAAGYVAASVVLCVFAAWAGHRLGVPV